MNTTMTFQDQASAFAASAADSAPAPFALLRAAGVLVPLMRTSPAVGMSSM